MKDEKVAMHLLDPIPGTTAHLLVHNLIPTTPEEKRNFSKIANDITSKRDQKGYFPPVIQEPPFNGRIVLPRCSRERPEFVVLSQQGFRIAFRPGIEPQPSILGLSFSPWDSDPESVGKGYGGFLAEFDNGYVLTILSIDRKRSLIIESCDDQVSNELLQAFLVTYQAARQESVYSKSEKRMWRQLKRVVSRSETLSVDASDPRTVKRALIAYRTYVDEVAEGTHNELITDIKIF